MFVERWPDSMSQTGRDLVSMVLMKSDQRNFMLFAVGLLSWWSWWIGAFLESIG